MAVVEIGVMWLHHECRSGHPHHFQRSVREHLYTVNSIAIGYGSQPPPHIHRILDTWSLPSMKNITEPAMGIHNRPLPDLVSWPIVDILVIGRIRIGKGVAHWPLRISAAQHGSLYGHQ